MFTGAESCADTFSLERGSREGDLISAYFHPCLGNLVH